MWPFSKKARNIEELPAITAESHSWGVAEAGYDGSALIIRFNQSAKEWAGHPELPIKLGFAVPLNVPNAGGLPDPDENEQFADIEDTIIREVDSKCRGIHALVLTTGTMKEFVFYISAGADIQSIHETLQKSITSHDIQCMAVKEPGWDSYTQFSP